MKKIIFSNYDDIKNPYYAGGGAYAIHEIAKRLTQYHKVLVITGKYPKSTNRKVDGVNYKRIGLSLGGPKIGQIAYQICLPFYVINLKFDVWFESFTPPFSTGFLQLFTKKPIIGLIHMLSGKDMKRKYKIPFDQVERVGLKTYKRFIVMSESIEKEIKEVNKSAEVINIKNGVDIKKIGNSKRKKQILFLGRIEVNQKGLDLLIKAFAKTAKNKDLKLIIAGNGEEKQIKILKNLIAENRVDKNVVLLGRVDKKTKVRLMSESLCLVVPSRFETFSITALEGLAVGLPVATFDIPGLNWIPNDLRLIAKPFSVSSLVEEIEKGIRKRTNEKAVLFAKKYTWKNTLNAYLKIVEGING